MALWMSWEVTPIASAGEEVDDVEEAVKALDGSVLRILDRAVTGVDAATLRESARVIRARMSSDGRVAVERGERWTAKVGEAEVTLTPRNGDSRPARAARDQTATRTSPA
ncbi:hypothetical protein OG840_22520 [Streptomyces sp. NBC_01764]|uniref:hypothetical protein n=1 Tax=Streptomyces sp. NBC_01764 TaxID=2975935 RepID=UPI00225464E5|nr:hypothetical protein [Streptomyces sp. NBC_01764]MCX4404389.1 hypothetical protein [Streptomyces sp. NBC_01764]